MKNRLGYVTIIVILLLFILGCSINFSNSSDKQTGSMDDLAKTVEVLSQKSSEPTIEINNSIDTDIQSEDDFTYVYWQCGEEVHVPANLPVAVGYKWVADTSQHVQDYLNAVAHQMQVNGKPYISQDVFGGIKKYDDNRYYSLIFLYFGDLTPGKYAFQTTISFKNKVFDGEIWVGPGTDNPANEGDCTIIVDPPSGPLASQPQNEENNNIPQVQEESTPCLLLGNITDVSFPDGTQMEPGERGIKTWRIENAGTCTWTPNFAISLKDGDYLGAPATPIKINQTVPPGGTVSVSIPLLAPSPGTYYGYWLMQDENGVRFGGGENADAPFWVKIQVAEKEEIKPLPQEEPEFIIDWGMKKITWVGFQKCGVVPGNPILEMQVKVTSVNFEGDVEAQVTMGGTTSYPLPIQMFNTAFVFDNDNTRKEFSISPGETKTLDLKIDTSSSNTSKLLNDYVEGSIWFHIKYLNHKVTNDLNYYSELPFEHTCIK